jgi:probable rRNA maturation factor
VAHAVLEGERQRSAALAITFVTPRDMARLHRQHLGVGGPTDIITFAHASHVRGAPLVADLYIAPAVAGENAARAGCSVREELARLTIHGVLHALGWTHPEGEGRTRSAMWRRQERWVERMRERGAW